MQLRRYCVTFTDNWTPLKLFWSEQGLRRYMLRWLRREKLIQLPAYVHWWRWRDGTWVKF